MIQGMFWRAAVGGKIDDAFPKSSGKSPQPCVRSLAGETRQLVAIGSAGAAELHQKSRDSNFNFNFAD